MILRASHIALAIVGALIWVISWWLGGVVIELLRR
jgi:hypothetical protein